MDAAEPAKKTQQSPHALPPVATCKVNVQVAHYTIHVLLSAGCPSGMWVLLQHGVSQHMLVPAYAGPSEERGTFSLHVAGPAPEI